MAAYSSWILGVFVLSCVAFTVSSDQACCVSGDVCDSCEFSVAGTGNDTTVWCCAECNGTVVVGSDGCMCDTESGDGILDSEGGDPSNCPLDSGEDSGEDSDEDEDEDEDDEWEDLEFGLGIAIPTVVGLLLLTAVSLWYHGRH